MLYVIIYYIFLYSYQQRIYNFQFFFLLVRFVDQFKILLFLLFAIFTLQSLNLRLQVTANSLKTEYFRIFCNNFITTSYLSSRYTVPIHIFNPARTRITVILTIDYFKKPLLTYRLFDRKLYHYSHDVFLTKLDQ